MSTETKETPPESMGKLFEGLAAMIAKNKNTQIDDKIVYPITVDTFQQFALKPETEKNRNVGGFVRVRPCGEKYENKTYLGIFLGDFPVGHMTSYNPDTKEMQIFLKRNPAMFVPDLNEIIWGMGSWWSDIENPEDLDQITDKDISNVWYVKALQTLDRAETAQ